MEREKNTQLKEPLGRIVGRINRTFLSTLQKRLAHLGIDRSFYAILLIDAANGMMNQTELAEKLSSDKVQIVRIVDYLVANGYVIRKQNPKDRREYKLCVTERGRDAVPEIRQVLQGLSDTVFQGMSENQVDGLYFILGLIEKNLLSLKNEGKE